MTILHITNLADSTHQNTLYAMEENASLFTSDTATPCDFNIIEDTPDLEINSKCKSNSKTLSGIHLQNKHKYSNTFGDSNIQYHDFDNGDALNFRDKYTALLQKELQNPYWCLHDPIMMKSYQISTEMDIETMPHAMYFSDNIETFTKINHVPYQTIVYHDRGIFQAKLMDETQVQIFIDNDAMPSILPLSTYNKYPLLRTYPTESNTPIHTGGGMIEPHFWIEIPLKLDNQIIQIKALVCDSECPHDMVLEHTSLAQLSTWQDYASRQLCIQQISIPLITKNNVQILPGNTRIVS